MIILKKVSIVCGLLLACITLQAGQPAPRTVVSMDAQWQFALGAQAGAEAPGFDDSAWRTLNVPHDWSIEAEVDEQNPSGSGGAYYPAGIGWYRKTFTVPAAWQGKKVYMEFDAIMANSSVWLNGHLLGNRPYGYIIIRYDMTPYLRFDGQNVLAVKADNDNQPASRWYAGAGIYRHTRMVAVEPLHISLAGGVYVTTPEIDSEKATVRIQTALQNEGSETCSVVVTTTIRNANGKTVATAVSDPQAVGKAQESVLTQQLVVPQPALWDIDSPTLYTAVSTVTAGKKVLDVVTTTFGIRKTEFRAATGFWINGRNIKLKGVCLHQDASAVGVAVPLSIWEKRLANLKKLGVNAIRCAHNPMDPGFLNLCDQMGLLVMDETFDTWLYAKKPYDYHLFFKDWWDTDTRDVVLRDRNHPSIVIYSVGNEIRENLNSEAGQKMYFDQQDLIHELDPTRPVTMALFRPNTQRVYDNGFADKMDVVGQNYRDNELEAAWKQNPDRKVLGTENVHTLQTWLYLRDQPYLAGQFLWPGIEYTGEAQWPMIYSSRGLLTRTNVVRVDGLQRRSWWAEEPVIGMSRQEAGAARIDWTPVQATAGAMQQVSVYTNCQEAELLLNGKSQGVKPKNADDSPIVFQVPFEAGELKAIGKNDGQPAATFVLHSAEAPVKLMLVPEGTSIKYDFEDVNFVRAYVCDHDGNRFPNNTYLVEFSIEGAGEIFATDNNDSSCHEKLKDNKKSTYLGECVALIKATAGKGQITVKAAADGLEPAAVTLKVVK